MKKTAIISNDGQYRYLLTREWNSALPVITWVMLNPSTADADHDDPTIRRCIAFSKQWGFGKLQVVNLFAKRSTNPLFLKSCSNPVGPENDHHILNAANECQKIVCAWGNCSFFKRDIEVLAILDRTIYCLGVTSSNKPKHPLYLKKTTQPIRYLPVLKHRPFNGVD